jgi:hypothetical protein
MRANPEGVLIFERSRYIGRGEAFVNGFLPAEMLTLAVMLFDFNL